jgi:hypothetical protein
MYTSVPELYDKSIYIHLVIYIYIHLILYIEYQIPGRTAHGHGAERAAPHKQQAVAPVNPGLKVDNLQPYQ